MARLLTLSLLLELASTAGADPVMIKVEASATQHAIHRGESAVIEVRVTNVSSEKQTFHIMNCAWRDSWRTDDRGIVVEGVGCEKNFEIELALAPGASDARKLAVVVTGDAAYGVHGVRLGWRPIGAKAITWSAPIAFDVVEVSTDVAVTSSKGYTFSLVNTTKRPLQIRSELTVQSEFEDSWTDLSPMDVSCGATPPMCQTLEPGKSLTTREWQATTCARCICHGNALAQRGNYRLVVHSCDGKQDYVGGAITLP
jgi:hypothetical protein